MTQVLLSFTAWSLGQFLPWTLTFLLGMQGILLLGYGIVATKYALQFSLPTKLLFACCLFIGIFIRFTLVPDGHRIYFDEDRYLTYSVNFIRYGQAVNIIASSPDRFIGGDPDPAARITVPMINAWTLKIFGFHEKNLFSVARIFSSGQIILAFVLVHLLYKKVRVSLFVTFLFAVLPTPVYWSVSSNIDSYFVYFSLLALLAAVLYAKKQSFPNSLFFSISILILLFVRFESFLFLPCIMMCIYALRRIAKIVIPTRSDIIVAMILIPCILLRASLSLPVFSQVWCCAEATPLEVFSPSYIFRNTLPNLSAFFLRPEFPYILSVLAIVEIIRKRRFQEKRDPRQWIFILWIANFFSIYSFYYAGLFFSYTFSGSYGRFFLMLIPPILILAGLCFDRLVSYFHRASFQSRNTILVVSAIACLPLVLSLPSYLTMIRLSPWDSLVEAGPRRLHAYIDDVLIDQTPRDSAIIIGVTAPILLRGKSVVYYDSFLTHDDTITFVEDYLKSGKRVFLFQTYTCDIFPERCVKIRPRFELIDAQIHDNRYNEFSIQEVVLRHKK